MKKIILIIMISISSLSCYDGLNDMLGNLDMKVPICVNSVTGSDIKDGRGWANAKATIQAAIDVADTGDEIWVAGDWSIGTTITVNESVSIYGGFNGSESWIEQRPGKSTVTGNVSSFNVKAQGVVIDGFNFNAKTSGNCILLETDGIYSITIINCEFNNNTTWVPLNTTCSAGNHHTVLISKCTFYKNAGAGAITALNSDLSIIDTSFTSNTTATSGGAINISGGSTVDIIDTDFFTNSASNDGGAIYADSGNTITIRDKCAFTGNHADGIGGAILCANNNTLLISDTDFISNYADIGGALHITKQTSDGTILSINGCDFDGNYTAGLSQGGAVYLDLYQGDTDTVNIIDCDFIQNSANKGGAMCTTGTGNSKITITDCEFGDETKSTHGNTAAGSVPQGGALYISTTHVICNNSDFYYNQAPSGGGAIITDNSTLTINGGTFYHNTAQGGTGVSGGAILALNPSTLNLNGITFTENSATADGGAICFTGSTLNISDCDFISNSVTTGGGGGLYTSGTCRILNSEFKSNTAINGGGIHQFNGDTEIWNSEITENTASSNGGGLFLNHDSSYTFKLINSKIINNNASAGTAVYKSEHYTDMIYIYNSLFADAPGASASLFYMSTTSTMTYIYNSSFISHNDLGQYIGNGGSLISYNCIFYGSSITQSEPAPVFNFFGTNRSEITGTNRIPITDPEISFTNFSAGDYTLRSGSPCVDAGNNDNAPTIVTTDLAGNPRIVGLKVDIGCYERQ